MLYEKNKDSLVFFTGHLTFCSLFGCLLCLEHIHEGALDDLNDSLIKLEGVFKLYIKLFVVVSVDKFVESLELLGIFVSQPIFDLCELGSDRSFLVSVQSLDLHIALISQILHNLVDCLIVDSFYDAAVSFGEHFGVFLSDVVVVDTVLAECKGNILALLILFLSLFLGNFANPSGFAGRIDRFKLLLFGNYFHILGQFLHCWV